MERLSKQSQYFPHYLFFIFSIVSLIRGFTISDSIALFALGAVSCYKFYLATKTAPDYGKEYKKELDTMKIELATLKTEVGQINFSSRRVTNEKIRF